MRPGPGWYRLVVHSRRFSPAAVTIALLWFVVAILLARILVARVWTGDTYADPPAPSVIGLAAVAASGLALGALAMVRPNRGVLGASVVWAAVVVPLGMVLLRFGHTSAWLIVPAAMIGGVLAWRARASAQAPGDSLGRPGRRRGH